MTQHHYPPVLQSTQSALQEQVTSTRNTDIIRQKVLQDTLADSYGEQDSYGMEYGTDHDDYGNDAEVLIDNQSESYCKPVA